MKKSCLFIIVSIVALLNIGIGTPAFAQMVNVASQTGTTFRTESAGWGPTTFGFDAVTCAFCGSDIETNYGLAATFMSQGSVGVTVSASASTGNLAIETNAGAGFSVTALGPVNPSYQFAYAGHAQPTFTQSGASASADISARLSLDNSVTGKVCVFTCTSFGTTLGAFDTSFTVLGFDTSGSGYFTALGLTVPYLNGHTVPITSNGQNFGDVSLNAAKNNVSHPIGTFDDGSTASSGSVTDNVAGISVNLTNIGTKLATAAGLPIPPLNNTYGIGPFSVGYNLLTADLVVYEDLKQHSDVFETNYAPTLSVFNKYGQAVALLVTDKVTGTQSTAYSVDVFDPFLLPASAARTGNYAVLQVGYDLRYTQYLDVSLAGTVHLTALGVEFAGSQYNAVSDYYPLFDTKDRVYQKTSIYSGISTQTFAFPDNGSDDSVPEPSLWAMMLTGFGFAGIALRRRRCAVA